LKKYRDDVVQKKILFINWSEYIWRGWLWLLLLFTNFVLQAFGSQ
jgi:hypothetical protein